MKQNNTEIINACVIVPRFNSTKNNNNNDQTIINGEQVEEAVNLAKAINLKVVFANEIKTKMTPATLFGSGKIEQIKRFSKNAEVVVVDHPLTPVQQKNLEKKWDTKVIDRTGLILEIFADRAKSREGKLQVELAQNQYQMGRLVRSWTHLERQRGGLGKVAGPGETQIEADRRQLRQKIKKIKQDIKKIEKTRKLHRQKREKSDMPLVALVGYTNAGKSTLFNRLTNAGTPAKDRLFETLDTTIRRIKTPHRIILSDTVGFIANLPTQLIAAFKATLEEVLYADLILHVRDVAHPESKQQAKVVYKILDEIGANNERVVEVMNKIDLIHNGNPNNYPSDNVAISAKDNVGIDELLKVIETKTNSCSDSQTEESAHEPSPHSTIHQESISPHQ